VQLAKEVEVVKKSRDSGGVVESGDADQTSGIKPQVLRNRLVFPREQLVELGRKLFQKVADHIDALRRRPFTDKLNCLCPESDCVQKICPAALPSREHASPVARRK
jgi:hypothetical protein